MQSVFYPDERINIRYSVSFLDISMISTAAFSQWVSEGSVDTIVQQIRHERLRGRQVDQPRHRRETDHQSVKRQQLSRAKHRIRSAFHTDRDASSFAAGWKAKRCAFVRDVQMLLWSLQVGRNPGLPVSWSWIVSSCGSSMCWTTASCWPINLCTRMSWKENTLWQTSSSERQSRPPSSFFKFEATTFEAASNNYFSK